MSARARFCARVIAWAICALSPTLGCGSGSGSNGGQDDPYECQASALILSGFQGSCDTRTAGSPAGQCHEWWGTEPTDVSTSCAEMGGTFDAANQCPVNNRLLRCSVGGTTLKVLHSYYAPTYSEGEAAAECSALSGRCVTGSGGE